MLPYQIVDIEALFYAFYRFLLDLGSVFDVTTQNATALAPDPSSIAFQNFYFLVEIFLFVVGLGALALIIYFTTRKREILRAGDYAFVQEYESKRVLTQKNMLWDSVQKHLATESQAEWKLAIIEADKLLDDITVKQGFFGETLGERLKNADESLFRNLADAWEAHKIRNRIAHEANYYLSRREAQRAISMYERVFREFKIL